MDKSSIAAITEHIEKAVKRGGNGYYCVIHQDNSVFDVYYAVVSSGIEFQMMGTDDFTVPEWLADNIFNELVVVDFVYLNDILLSQYRDRPDNF